jgi:hypothetical protein
VFHVRVAGAVPDGRVRTAVLEDYDGHRWAPARPFTAVSGPIGPPATGDVIEQDYELAAAFPGPFLPVVGQPVALGGAAGLAIDRATGTIRLPHRPAAALALRYHVTSRPPPTRDLDPQERVALTRLPGPVPPAVAGHHRRVGALPATRAGLDLLAASVRELAVGFDAGAPPGHSYPRLAAFLDPTSPARGRAGTSEQPAAAFAVLARLLGVPSRVVVGYRLPAGGADAAAPVAVAVTAHRAHAWAEVHLPGAGWVAYDPTTTRSPPPAPGEDAAAPASTTTAVTRRQSPAPAARPGQAPPISAPCGPGDGACRPARPPDRRALVLVAAAALPAPPVSVLAAKALRRRRRRRGDPAARVAGAWRESVERIRAHGLPAPASRTAAEVVAACPAGPGDAVTGALTAWVAVLDAAIYAAGEPTAHLADTAWETDAALAEAFRSRTALVRRIGLALDPRPLLPAAGLRRPRGRRRRPGLGRRGRS